MTRCTAENTHIRWPRLVLLVAAVVAATSPAEAQLVNGEFDTDTSSWTVGTNATLMWSSDDSDGDPGSGSADITNVSSSSADAIAVRQCGGTVTPGETYRLAGDILVPSGQTETGEARFLVQFYSLEQCTGTNLGAFVSPGIPHTTTDVWTEETFRVVAPANAASIRVGLSVLKWEDVGTLAAMFDGLVLAEEIFVDDFETGDTTMWSSTTP